MYNKIMTKFIERQVDFEPADTSMAARRFLDVAYANGDRDKLDIYLPAGTGPFPVIVDVYGGGLYFGEKSSHKLQPSLQLLSHGYAVVSVNYSLDWQSPFPNQIAELQTAVNFLADHAAEFDLDMTDTTLIGESSGAQLAVLATAVWSVGQTLGAGAPARIPAIQRVMGFYGPYQVDAFSAQFGQLGITPKFAETGAADSFEGVMLGGRPADLPDKVALANPATYFTAKMPPLLLMAGTADAVVPYLQSVQLAADYKRLVSPDKLVTQWVTWAQHGPADFMSDDILATKLAFLKGDET